MESGFSKKKKKKVGMSLPIIYNGNSIQRKTAVNSKVKKKYIQNYEFVNAVKTKIVKNPTIFMHKIDAELKRNSTTIRTIMNNDLSHKSLIKTPRHEFIEDQKAGKAQENARMPGIIRPLLKKKKKF